MSYSKEVGEVSARWQPGSAWEHRRVDGSGAVDAVGQVIKAEPPTRLVITFEDAPDAETPREPSVVTFLVEPHQDIAPPHRDPRESPQPGDAQRHLARMAGRAGEPQVAARDRRGPPAGALGDVQRPRLRRQPPQPFPTHRRPPVSCPRTPSWSISPCRSENLVTGQGRRGFALEHRPRSPGSYARRRYRRASDGTCTMATPRLPSPPLSLCHRGRCRSPRGEVTWTRGEVLGALR